MKDIEFENLKLDSIKLLDTGIQLVQDMLTIPGLVDTPDSEEINDVSVENIVGRSDKEVLVGEKNKLENLEMVIAVVGTMKAGKSTTINAMVGAEVLPNRNRPMTSIPTLIRHSKDVHTPVLEFKNNSPINLHMKELKGIISMPEYSGLIEKELKDKDMQLLLSTLSKGEEYKAEYTGEEKIFEFLRGLNDLVRLSATLKYDFPFLDYDEMHEFPVIKYNFSHLADIKDAQGIITLLDTPGPNEEKQEHLKEMVKDQLNKSSAVILVIDYAQQKSNAESQVKDYIEAISDTAEGKIFVFVNKFDQLDRNGQTEKELINRISGEMFNSRIPPENIFPVSSKWGYLANRAKTELTKNNSLKISPNNPWIEDFAREAFGETWMPSDLTDNQEVLEKADELWEDSRFSAPLQKMLKESYKNASILSLDSALIKINHFFVKTNNLFTLRRESILRSAEDISRQIENIQHSINQIDLLHNESKKSSTEKMQIMLNRLNSGVQETEAALNHQIEHFFSSYGSKRTLDYESDATDLVQKIATNIQNMVSDAKDNIKNIISEEVADYSSYFKDNVDSRVRFVLSDIQRTLEKEIGNITIDFPEIEEIEFPSDRKLQLSGLVSSRTESRTVNRVIPPFLSTFKSRGLGNFSQFLFRCYAT